MWPGAIRITLRGGVIHQRHTAKTINEKKPQYISGDCHDHSAQLVVRWASRRMVCGSSPGRGNKDIFSKKKFLINTPALLGFHESYSNKKSEEVIFFAIKIVYEMACSDHFPKNPPEGRFLMPRAKYV